MVAFRDLSKKERDGIMDTSIAGHVRPEAVLTAVSRHFKIHMSNLLGPRRDSHCAYPRHIVMHLLREHTNLSWPKMGKLLGRNHSTCISGARKIGRLRAKDPGCQETLAEILTQLNLQEALNASTSMSPTIIVIRVTPRA